MRFWMVFIFILLTLGMLSAWILEGDNGYVLITLHGWSIQTSVVVLFIIFVVFFALLQMLTSLFSLLNPLRLWRKGRRFFQNDPNEDIRQGIHELLKKNPQEAYRLLMQSAEASNIPEANFLLAAIAAKKHRDLHGVRFAMDEAKSRVPELKEQLENFKQELRENLISIKGNSSSSDE